MRVGLFLYRQLTRLLSPFTGWLLQRRVARGKENSKRLNERVARQLPPRPDGTLVWFHAASVGESMLHLAIARTLLERGYTINCLFTCQTLTAADRINDSLAQNDRFAQTWTLQQMAPLDTPGIAQSFVTHWQPDLAVFAEGDVWPNLLTCLQTAGTSTALINARMTDKSLTGWSQWPKTAAHVFGGFDALLASDKKTSMGLQSLIGHPVPCPGNLKSALPPPPVSLDELTAIRAQIGDRKVLFAASTHTGEEALVIDAIMRMDKRPFTIIAPRHPERGDQVQTLLEISQLKFARRSHEDAITPETDVLLADTMGEMGLWFRLADTVYLGGGHTPGVGGHNPLEPLRLGKPVLTGPSLFNFADMTRDLADKGGLVIIDSAEDLISQFPAPAPPAALIDELEQNAFEPMNATVAALVPLLPAKDGAS